MDPNATLKRIRELLGELAVAYDGNADNESAFEDAANELAEQVNALDEWMSKGGFSPWPVSLLPKEASDNTLSSGSDFDPQGYGDFT